MLTKQIVRQSNIIKTLNPSALVATMADCFFMGYTFIYVHKGELSVGRNHTPATASRRRVSASAIKALGVPTFIRIKP